MRITFLLLAFLAFNIQMQAQERTAPSRTEGMREATARNAATQDSRDKAAYVASISPNVTVNGTECKFKEAALAMTGNGKYMVKIRFSESCSGHSEVSFAFDKLEDALAVKELLMSYRTYQSFNITAKKDMPATFEVIYTATPRR